jgi:RNA-directed DNA polymerase
MSRIEDFFEPSLLATELEGKKFNPSKDHRADGEYGKYVFAEKVVRPNADNINFSGFAPLLNRIVAVLDDYSPPA